jgi:acetyltransferase-like isoleucine patch superfamily enzyme
MRRLLQFLLLLLPWSLRRRALAVAFGYQLDPAARIGWAWIDPVRLVVGPGSSIGHLTVCKGLSLLSLGAQARIGRGNWITGFPPGGTRHFLHEPDRAPELHVVTHAAITNRHLIECTNRVELGAFSTFAGVRSQILTHSIDLGSCRQSSAPVRIGRYCFVGTGCTLLAGSSLPDFSALAAMSLLTSAPTLTHRLYTGVPATEVGALDESLGYFHRETGFVD